MVYASPNIVAQPVTLLPCPAVQAAAEQARQHQSGQSQKELSSAVDANHDLETQLASLGRHVVANHFASCCLISQYITITYVIKPIAVLK